MIDMFPIFSYLLIFSYFFLVYVIFLNLIFVILLDALYKIKRNHVVTLLEYKIIWNGLKQFLINWTLRIAGYLKMQKQIKVFLEKITKLKDL
jgi:hypothetical protein